MLQDNVVFWAFILVAAWVARVVWRQRSRRAAEPGFEYVYVNQDGSVRELSPKEQVYLSTPFHGADGGRPYVKSRYDSKDGWGSLSGFVERRRVPSTLVIRGVHPDFDARVTTSPDNLLDVLLGGGADAVHNADGSVTITPNPAISPKERMEGARAVQLASQRRREALADLDD